MAEFELADLSRTLREDLVVDPDELAAVRGYELGELDGVRLCFSDATALTATLVCFSASAEGEEGGDIHGSVVGTISDDGPVNRLRTIDPRWKVEGVHATVDTGVFDFLFVCDEDDPGTSLPLLSATMPVSARRARGSRRCYACSTGSPIPTPAPSATGAPTPVRSTRCGFAARSPWFRSCRSCSTGPSPSTSASPRSLAGREPDVGRLLRLAGLEASFADRDVRRLSVGEQQRAMIARALALEPDVMLLDEPTSALDEEARDSIERTVADLGRRLGAAIVIVTHDPGQARRLADWIVSIDGGRLVREGPATEVLA